MKETKTLHTHIATYGIDWLYILFLYSYATFFAVVIIAWQLTPVLIVMGILYGMTLKILQNRFPKIDLFDNGIQVTQNHQTNQWYWCDITSMSGTRHYQSMNLLPAFRHGANHFYHGNEELFSVSVFIINATPLVKYILIKMTECLLSRLTSELKNDDDFVDIENFRIGPKGIGNNKAFYDWYTIEDVIIKGDNYTSKIFVKLKDNKKTLRLGKLEWRNSILLMAIVDFLTGSMHLATLASDAIDVRKRMLWWGRVIGIMVLLSVVLYYVFLNR